MHGMRPRLSNRPLFVELVENIEQRIDRAAALTVRRQLPPFVAGGLHDRPELRRRNEQLPTIVRVRHPIELFSERAIRIALIRRADRHAAIERYLERRELQPS